MIRPFVTLLLLIAVPAGCALISGEPEEEPFRAEDLEAFTERIRESFAVHEWQALLAAADPEHYRTQVVELGMDEPQYVAELFGLHTVNNTIQEGDTLEWSDLERTESVSLRPASDEGPPYRLIGTVILENGERLEIDATAIRIRGRFALTGGVG
ncbi:MAG: hypothetical protein WD766_14740 [Gemmatimonadota bacterium]